MPAFEQLANGAVDPTVNLPDSVKRAAAAAEAHYANPNPTPADNSGVLPNATPAQHPGLQQPDVTAAVTDPTPAAPKPEAEPKAGDQSVDWESRYNSMRGRFNASQRQLGIVQQQNMELANELTQTQNMLSRAGTVPAAPQITDHNRVIADPQDVDTYGGEMMEAVARTARLAVQPEIEALKTENAELKKTAISTAQKDLQRALATAVPNWKAIQNSPQWRSFTALPNIYTGVPRSQTLKAAWDAANASQTIAVFKEFITELKATGQQVPGETPPAAQAPDPALNLADLAAPGHARPAGGDTPNQPLDQPVITRAFITQHYAKSRQGYYAGRQDEYDRTEAAIQAAQRAGRIQG